MLQSLVWMSGCPQATTPPSFTHFLVRVLVPRPQVTEHRLHDDHSSHSPCTANAHRRTRTTRMRNEGSEGGEGTGGEGLEHPITGKRVREWEKHEILNESEHIPKNKKNKRKRKKATFWPPQKTFQSQRKRDTENEAVLTCHYMKENEG